MGYTHTFSCQPGSAEHTLAWPRIVADTRRILHGVRRGGIITRGVGVRVTCTARYS